MKKVLITLISIGFILIISTGYTQVVNLPIVTGKASLSWDANLEPDLAGYRIYQSQISGEYSLPAVVDIPVPIVGKPFFKISGLKEDTTYFWVLTAYDTSGNESTFSNEVTKTINVSPGAPVGFDISIILEFTVVPQ